MDTKDTQASQEAIRIWQQCDAMLEQYWHSMNQAFRNGAQETEAPAIMFRRGVEFARSTIRACIALLELGEENSIFVCTLCRAFYEVSVRLLWAARTKHGWERLQAYWANEDRRWAEEARLIPQTKQIAESTLRDSQSLLERKDAGGQRIEPAPPIQQLLRDIVEQNVAGGVREESKDAADFDYTNVYRFLCNAAHGHIISIGRPAQFLRHARYAITMATWCLLQACVHSAWNDPKTELDSVLVQLRNLIRENREAPPN